MDLIAAEADRFPYTINRPERSRFNDRSSSDDGKRLGENARPPPGGLKRVHRHAGTEPNDDISRKDEDDAEGQPSKRLKMTTENGRQWAAQDKRLVCPYFKRDSKTHRKSCARRDFPNVGRLKEHLFRYHLLPRCTRCKVKFDDNNTLNAHGRETVGCEYVQKEEIHHLEGFDAEQWSKIKERDKGKDDIWKWRRIYLVLFSDILEEDIPSPYVDDGDFENTACKPRQSHMQLLEQWDNYRRVRQIPRIRSGLASVFTPGVVDKVCNLIDSLLNKDNANLRLDFLGTNCTSLDRLSPASSIDGTGVTQPDLDPNLSHHYEQLLHTGNSVNDQRSVAWNSDNLDEQLAHAVREYSGYDGSGSIIAGVDLHSLQLTASDGNCANQPVVSDFTQSTAFIDRHLVNFDMPHNLPAQWSHVFNDSRHTLASSQENSPEESRFNQSQSPSNDTDFLGFTGVSDADANTNTPHDWSEFMEGLSF